MENKYIKAEVLPELGGKIKSIYYKAKEFEAVAQNTRNVYEKSDETTPFDQRDASGIDDAFPTIVKEVVVIEGKSYEYTDHGEIWRSEFQVMKYTETSIDMKFISKKYDYCYIKKIKLEDNQVKIMYEIQNVGEEKIPCFWTFHGLMRYEENMRFKYPKGTKEFRNVMEEKLLGEVDNIYNMDNDSYDFTRVPKAHTLDAKKFYVEGKVSEGYCRYEYPTQGMVCELRFDEKKLPYLGMWITAGGFRGDYNCAFEPSNGFYDSVSKVWKNQTLQFLEPKEKFIFEIEIGLYNM